VGLLGIDGNDSEWVRKLEYISLEETISCDD
jgi:hypothetical protein